MNKHWAAALLIGMRFVPDAPAFGFSDKQQHHSASLPSVLPIGTPTLMRRPSFDHLRTAGRFRREELARFAMADGRLWAECAESIEAPEPRRLETNELDAEWMAHAPPLPGNDLSIRPWWSLFRRDLQAAPDGSYWAVQLHAMRNDPSELQIVATAEHPLSRGGHWTVHTLYTQRPETVCLAFWDEHNNQQLPSTELLAPDLASMAINHPTEVRLHLAPAIRRIANIDLP